MKQTQTELTPEQKVFLDKYTEGSWELNSKTGLVDVKGNFYCSKQGLTSFEGIRFGKVSGDFYCPNNKLTSLAGAPEKVGGDFLCSNNKLTTLEGAPLEVGKGFSCSMNALTTLEGAPGKVGKEFSCEDNELTTLKGAPGKVNGSFYCSNNKLTTLEGAPLEVGGDFFCAANKLTTLEGAPEKVGWDFDCSDNSLTTLKGAPREVGKFFDCSGNPKLKSLDGRPEKVGKSLFSNIKESHVKMFEQFINDELNEKGSKIDPKELRLTKTISIWGNPEKFLAAEFGKDLGLPKYPKTGPITWKDEEIGFVSNWSGTVFTDMKWVEDNLDSLNKVVDKTGFWYS